MKRVLSLITCVILTFMLVFSTACSNSQTITPKLRINQTTNEWEVSYDNEVTWTSLGVKATGEQGDKGEQGEQGLQGVTPKLRINQTTNEWEVSYDNEVTWISLGVKATGGSGSSSGGNAGDENQGGVGGDGEYNPVIRFAVTSDVHLRQGNSMGSKDQLDKVYDSAYAYSKNQELNSGYNKLDGIFFVGDNVNYGTTYEYTEFFDYVENYTRSGTLARAVMGNHEYSVTTRPNGWNQTSINDAIDLFLGASGYETEDYHAVINGYHFLFVSMDRYGGSTGTYYEFISSGKLEWLKQELDIALADDPTGEKPIFVFNHVHPQNTVEGSTSGDKFLKELLDDYPNVVDFSGHTHRPITDPRSIWQGGFTAINTGSMAYLGHPIPGHPTYGAKAVTAFDNTGEWYVADEEHAARDGGLYYICEIDANNLMRVFVYDTFSDSVFGEPMYIDSFGDPTGFDYKAYRESDSIAPKFAETDEITIVNNLFNRVEITFPQATGQDLVSNYRIEVYKGSELVNTEYRLSGCHYGNAMPENMSVTIAGLAPSTTYKLKVYAVNYWSKVSKALEKEFTTASALSTANADIVSITFAETGGVDALGGVVLKKDEGAVVMDTDLSKYVGSFNGRAAYIYWGLDKWYSVMKAGFAVETYVKVTAMPASGKSYGLVTSMESGGFGLYYSGEGEYRFTCNLGGTNYSAKRAGNMNEWVHLVGVYEGATIKLYINGELVATTPVSGIYKAPSLTAQFLAVGADSYTEDRIEYQSKSRIAVTNMYSYALSAEQVQEVYGKI